MEAHGAPPNDQMLANYYMQYAAGNEYLGSHVRDSDEDYVPTPMYREEKKTIDNTGNGDPINHKSEPKKKNYKDVYYCDLCDWSGSHTSYYNHKKYVHQGISYSCDQCEYSGTRDAVKHHKDSKHSEGKYPCDLCDRKLATADGLRNHIKYVHTKAKGFPCEHCEYVAYVRSRLKSHIAAKHETNLFPCSIDGCDYAANTERNLKVHIKKHTEEGRALKNTIVSCNQCEYKGKYFAVYAHKKTVHFVGERKKFFCDLCDHSTLSKARLKTHRERKHIGITYPCDECDMVFKGKYTLKWHKDGVHQGLTFPCDKCDYVGNLLPSLRRHQYEKHAKDEDGNYLEPEINYYVCYTCNHVTGHRPGQGSEFSGSCPKCGNPATEAPEFKQKNIHACEHCESIFSKYYDLKTHMATKHEIGFQCGNCKKVLSTLLNWQSHILVGCHAPPPKMKPKHSGQKRGPKPQKRASQPNKALRIEMPKIEDYADLDLEIKMEAEDENDYEDLDLVEEKDLTSDKPDPLDLPGEAVSDLLRRPHLSVSVTTPAARRKERGGNDEGVKAEALVEVKMEADEGDTKEEENDG